MYFILTLVRIQQWASPIWAMCAYSITRNKVEWVDHAQPCIVPPCYEPNCCFLLYGYLATLNSSTLIKVTFNLDNYSNSYYPLPNDRKLILPKKESFSFITNPTSNVLFCFFFLFSFSFFQIYRYCSGKPPPQTDFFDFFGNSFVQGY